ncbi:MAG: hypothetical protein ACRETW_05605 [Stenotrophobium sp.]
MFKIYDERILKRRMRLRQVQIAAIFIAGAAFGLWVSSSDPGEAMASTAHVIPVAKTANAWCNDTRTLRMDCELKSAASPAAR